MSKNKLNVLLTRPLQKSQQLAKEIAPIASNIEITPLFAYKPGEQQVSLKQQLNNLNPEFIIIISPAAANFALQVTNFSNHIKSTTFIAVGQASANVLIAHGIENVIVPSIETSEGLLALSELQNIANKQVLIIRGNGGREFLKQQLELKQAKVAYNEVYKRQWLTFSAEQTIDKWRKDEINCIVITSSELLNKTLDLIADKNWANSCYWIVASTRIAEQAKAHGLKHVINANGANHQQIFQAMMALI
ncbi:uroporphyrinogen-III synthase [Thalassotalea psychrophila]|uniref:Uroporphyrinogen-III synthase n=1 Tax=Thalassotalea psychrophila TaxID=3065647 RepID=A0ABY9TW08_9GAMM|nr:uroporphyrinogen-III synthase [Colwelliaceae bacterium SQ149]